MEILTPESARFATRPATPPTASENQNEGITILYTEIAVAAESLPPGDMRVAVLLTPLGEKWPQLLAPALTRLEDWK